MADRPQIQYGASGDDVKELQRQLNANGFQLTVDGIWGDNTEAAVRKYQKQNGLAVDGIVGANTWASLLGGNASSSTTAAPSFEYDDFQYGDYKAPDPFEHAGYKESNEVTQAGKNKTDAENALAGYGDFSYSNQETFEDIMDKILNREEFSYDLNGDALYQQYKDKYIQQGKMAMQDTMGQASAMTGGYGNSYAATVGNQAYQASLENLNDIVPELYQMAYDRYNQEGQDMYNQYAMLSDDRATKYSEWLDGYSKLAADRDYYASAYDSERNLDYNKYADERNFAYGQYSDDRNFGYNQYSDDRNFAYGQYADDKSYAYQTHRDAIADEQWQQQFDEARRQYNAEMSLAQEQWEWQKANAVPTGSSGGSGGGSGSGGSGGSDDDPGFTYVSNQTTTDFKNLFPDLATFNRYDDGYEYNGKKYKDWEEFCDAKISDALDAGTLTEDEAYSIMIDLGLVE